MLHTTSSELVKKCLPPLPVKGGGKKKVATLCSQFKKSLAELVATLQTTEPHFVRCMKPNKEKVGGQFTSQMMLEQMRYAGRAARPLTNRGAAADVPRRRGGARGRDSPRRPGPSPRPR